MTLLNIAKLPTASFRGVEFHYQSGTVAGGRKTITHEYPSTRNRYVEDNGGLEKKFTINAWTDDNVSFLDRNNLISVLDIGGAGPLIHPKYGIQNVVSIGYSIVDDINQLGISSITINFEVAGLNNLPEIAKGNKGFLAELKTNILTGNKIVFEKEFNIFGNKTSFNSANATTKDSAREVSRVSQLVQGSTSTFSDFTTSINQIINSSASLVQSPSVLANNLKLAFDNLSVAYDSSRSVFDVVINMFGFNQADREAKGKSQLEKNIKNNQDQISNFINSSALALAYNAAGNISYKTLEDLNEVISILENGFLQIPLNLNKGIYQAILEIRLETSTIFANLAVGLPNIIDYEIINPISLNNFVYNFYGSLLLKNDIKNLNEFQDTSRILGTIKTLSDV